MSFIIEICKLSCFGKEIDENVTRNIDSYIATQRAKHAQKFENFSYSCSKINFVIGINN